MEKNYIQEIKAEIAKALKIFGGLLSFEQKGLLGDLPILTSIGTEIKAFTQEIQTDRDMSGERGGVMLARIKYTVAQVGELESQVHKKLKGESAQPTKDVVPPTTPISNEGVECTWNYRVIRSGKECSIFKVYSRLDGSLAAHEPVPESVTWVEGGGENVALKLRRMEEALGKDILEEKDFPTGRARVRIWRG